MIERKGAKPKAALGIVLSCFSVCLTAVVVQGQSFDAATIKSTPIVNAGNRQPSVVLFLPGGGLRRTNSTLRTLARKAYGNGETIDTNGPSIFSAIQEQLGVKLEPGKRFR